MSLSNAQRDGFDRRISRIKKGGANTMGEVHIGPVDEEVARSSKKGKGRNTIRVKRKNPKKVDLTSGSTLTLSILAVFFGALSMFVGQAMDFHFFASGGLLNMTPPAMAEDYMQYAQFAFGGLLALAFGWTFRLMRGLRFLALLAGFGAVYYYQSDLIQTLPGLYTGFFSKQFVEAALAAA